MPSNICDICKGYSTDVLCYKSALQDDVPKFMGMPLYGLKDYKEEKIKEDLTEDEVFYLNGLGSQVQYFNDCSKYFLSFSSNIFYRPAVRAPP